MLEPLKQWYCDVCQGIIEDPDCGIVVWEQDSESRPGKFRIVHRDACDRKRLQCHENIREMLGPDGLAYLLSFLSPGPVWIRMERQIPQLQDIHEFVKLVRRLHSPYYEEARFLTASDYALENSDNEYRLYTESGLKALIENGSDE